jgi:hypothetical protein
MKLVFSALLGLVALCGTTLLWGPPARAHSWYPADCCSGEDCAPVDGMAWIVPAGGGQARLVVTTAHGKAVIPYGFPVKASKDSRMHACMRDHYGEMTVICVFAPPGM